MFCRPLLPPVLLRKLTNVTQCARWRKGLVEARPSGRDLPENVLSFLLRTMYECEPREPVGKILWIFVKTSSYNLRNEPLNTGKYRQIQFSSNSSTHNKGLKWYAMLWHLNQWTFQMTLIFCIQIFSQFYWPSYGSKEMSWGSSLFDPLSLICT